MAETEILLTIAEIGIAVAGFASLATVIGHRRKNTDPKVNAIRLRGLLDAGLSTMMLALIAVLLLQIGASDDWVWRASSVVGLCFVAPVGLIAFRREKLRRHLPGYKKPIATVMFSLIALVFVGFLINSMGLTGDHGFHIYVGMLIVLLAICSTMFVLVIASLLSPEPEHES